MAARIPGHRMPQIQPLHADGTVCEHPTAPSGKPRDPDSGCTGRANYRATCECGWNGVQPIRESLNAAREWHRSKAAAAAAEERRAATTQGARTQAGSLTVTWKGSSRDVLYHRDWPTSRLLAEAIRAHGLKAAANTHLRLYVEGRQGCQPHDATRIDETGICSGDRMDLRPSGPGAP